MIGTSSDCSRRFASCLLVHVVNRTQNGVGVRRFLAVLDSILWLWKHINKVLEKLVVAKLVEQLPACYVSFMEPAGALRCSLCLWRLGGCVSVQVVTWCCRRLHCLWNIGNGLFDLEDEGRYCDSVKCWLVAICLVSQCHISLDLNLQGPASSIRLLVSAGH